MKYKIKVDRAICIACGVCYSTDPTHFESSDEGKSKVVGGTSNGDSLGSFDDDKIDDAKVAAAACPVSAIVPESIDQSNKKTPSKLKKKISKPRKVNTNQKYKKTRSID